MSEIAMLRQSTSHFGGFYVGAEDRDEYSAEYLRAFRQSRLAPALPVHV